MSRISPRILSRPRHAGGRTTALRPAKAGITLAAGAALLLGSLALPAQGATQYANIDREELQPYSGRLEVKEDGAVIDGLLVQGKIDIKADNVTIKNTIVESSDANSIRVYAGYEGTQLQNTQVYCEDGANGVVHGDYTADRVDLFDCRHDFLFSDDRPATITNSSIDGVAFSTVVSPVDPDETATEEPTEEPSVEPAPSEEPAPEPVETQGPAPEPVETQEPAPEPTESEEPTQEPAPEPSAPSFSGFPDASNTGVPAGVSLRSSGSLTITTPGTVIDGLDVNGSIDVQADNVTIRNSRVSTGSARYPIRVHPGVTGVLIEHVEVSNEGGDGKGIYFNSGSGTVRYSNIHSAEDGIFITADNVTVEYNYVHTLMRNAGAHPDAIQIRGGDNVTIRGNNLQAIHPQTGVSNAAIQIGSLVGDTITNFRVTDNLMNGGRFTINGGGRGEVDSAVYSGNQFGRDHQYGVAGNIENSVWDASNVYADNGQRAR